MPYAIQTNYSPERNIMHAKELLASMTQEEKVGQLFIARFPEENAPEIAAHYHLGGYILFARDFAHETPESIADKLHRVQSAQKLPMLIGVDEEGGTVNRVSRFAQYRATPFAEPQAVYATGGLAAVSDDTAEKCALLRALGINMNFAPVCDISTEPDDFMYARAFGQPAAQTADYVRTVVREMRRGGIVSVLKHFPGYGGTADTHTGIARDTRPRAVFDESDLLPFRAGMEEGADIVLVAHNIVECIDASRPASISPAVYTLLRAALGEDIVAITDDLAMRGLRDFIDDGSAAVAAVVAGNDLLCCTDFEAQVPAVLRAVRDGVIDEARLNQAVERVLRLKLARKILSAKA